MWKSAMSLSFLQGYSSTEEQEEEEDEHGQIHLPPLFRRQTTVLKTIPQLPNDTIPPSLISPIPSVNQLFDAFYRVWFLFRPKFLSFIF